MDKLESLRQRCPTVPYRNVLKAFAYGNEDFERALEVIALFDFAVPAQNDPKYSPLKKRYELEKRRAQKLDNGFKFSNTQLRKKHIIEMSHWISTMAFKNDEVSEEVLATREMLDDIRDVNMRKIMCTMLRLPKTYNPEDIAKEFRNPNLNISAAWGVERISLFWHYWWNVEKMNFNDWLIYLSWLGEKDRHYHYVHDLVREKDALKIRWKTHLLREVKDSEVISGFKTDINELRKMASQEGDIKGLGTLANAFTKLCNLGKQDTPEEGKTEDIYEDIRLVMTEKQLKEEGLTREQVGVKAPVTLDDIGEFNDPTDIGEDLESFADDE
jgi:predicted XRE-type DNA-binding protein